MAVEQRSALDRWARFAPLTGVVAVALWIIGTAIGMSDEPDEDAGPQEFLSYFADNAGTIITGAFLFVLGTLFFLWFLGSLRARLHVFEGGVGRVTAIAYSAGVGTAIFLIAFASIQANAAIHEDDMSPDTAEMHWRLTTAFLGAAELIAVLLLVGTALVVLRTAALPRWLAWVSLVLALLLLIIPIGWIALLFGLPLWVLATSLLLWRADPGPAPTAQTMREPAPPA